MFFGAGVSKVYRGFLVALGLSACAHNKIPTTQIDDTPDNRTVIRIVESYQQAFQKRDAPALLALVSPAFYEDNGNTDATDDYDRAGLEAHLKKEFEHTKRVQLELQIDDVVVEDTRAYAFVLYTLRSQNEYPAGVKWHTSTDRVRIELEKSGNDWLIRSGI